MKQEPKDLTSTLLQSNLSQLNLSASKPANSQPNYSGITSPTWQGGNFNENQWKGSDMLTASYKSPSAIQNNGMDWSGNGMNSSTNWGSQYSSTNWNQSRPVNPMNSNLGSLMSPGSNIPPTSLLLGPTSPEQTKKNLSTQDIIDLLS